MAALDFDTYREYIEFLGSYRSYNYNYTQTINHQAYIAYYIENEGVDIQDITKDILDLILRCGVDNEYCEDYAVLILACIMNGAKLKPFTKYIFAKPEEINIEDYYSFYDLERHIETRGAIINFCRKLFDIDYILNYTNWDEVEKYISDLYSNRIHLRDFSREEINKVIMRMYKTYISFKNLREEQEIRRIANKKRAMLSRNALAAQMIVTGRGPKAPEVIPAGGAGAAAPAHAGPAGGAGAAAPANVSVLEGLPQETRNLIASFISGAERNHLNPIKAKIAKETAKLPRRRKHRTRRRN